MEIKNVFYSGPNNYMRKNGKLRWSLWNVNLKWEFKLFVAVRMNEQKINDFEGGNKQTVIVLESELFYGIRKFNLIRI